MELADVDDPAGEKQHYRPVVPASGRTADAGRGLPATPKTNPQERTQKADDAGRIREGRTDETPARDRGIPAPSRKPKHGTPESAESGNDETDGGPSGNP